MLEEMQACCPQWYFDVVLFVHLDVLLLPGSGTQGKEHSLGQSDSATAQTFVPQLNKAWPTKQLLKWRRTVLLGRSWEMEEAAIAVNYVEVHVLEPV